MFLVQPQLTRRIDIDIPVEERLIPVHVPKYVERYARQLAEQYGDVEQ